MQPIDNLRARPPLDTTSTGAAFESLRTEFIEAALRDPECKVRTPDARDQMQSVVSILNEDMDDRGLAELLRIACATDAGKHWLDQRARKHARWHADELTRLIAEGEETAPMRERAFLKAEARKYTGEALTGFGSLA